MIKTNYYKLFSLVILAALTLTACKVGKEYQRPELELPTQFTTISFADTSSIADLDWKAFFADTTLQGLIEKEFNTITTC
jgi:outer membrane protein TolC